MRTIKVVAFLLSCFSGQALGWWFWTPGDTVDDSTQNGLVVGYHPDQPIDFNHKLHAGERKIDCQFCHTGARRSSSAVIPPVNNCMGCHKIIATDKEPIKWLTEKYKNNEPIEWVKVHDLPDHVRFSHKPHALAEISCQTCHGPVETMGTAEQWAPLQMGWCLDCHKENNASISCSTCHY